MNIVAQSYTSKGFSRPNTLLPVAAVYRMITPVGLPKGHEPHLHPDTLEICAVVRGRMDWWIGETPYEVRSGDVMVMLPGEPHGSLDSTLEPCEYWTVHIDPADLDPEVEEAMRSPGMSGRHPGHPRHAEYVQAIYREHERPDSHGSTICRSLTGLLIAELARDRFTSSKREPSAFIQAAQRELLARMSSSTPVEEVAEILGVSTVWLTKRFRNEVGDPPGEWLRAAKIREAKRLLAVEGCNVTETADMLGFASSQYFATAFRRATGTTPSDYRDRNRSQKHSRARVVEAPI